MIELDITLSKGDLVDYLLHSLNTLRSALLRYTAACRVPVVLTILGSATLYLPLWPSTRPALFLCIYFNNLYHSYNSSVSSLLFFLALNLLLLRVVCAFFFHTLCQCLNRGAVAMLPSRSKTNVKPLYHTITRWLESVV